MHVPVRAKKSNGLVGDGQLMQGMEHCLLFKCGDAKQPKSLAIAVSLCYTSMIMSFFLCLYVH